MKEHQPTFGPFIPAARIHGIGKTRAEELKRAELVKVFYIGRKAYTYFSEWETLPQRLNTPEGRAALERAKYRQPSRIAA